VQVLVCDSFTYVWFVGFDYGIGIDRHGPNVKLKDASRFTFMLGYEPE
jgi:outer membrane protein insertion porin family